MRRPLSDGTARRTGPGVPLGVGPLGPLAISAHATTVGLVFKTPIGRLRALGMLEGASFLVLLFVAMPLKYVWDMPMAVKTVGWVHGLLFVLFLAALLQAMTEREWSLGKAGGFLLAALLPFGPFVVDGKLRREDALPQGGHN